MNLNRYNGWAVDEVARIAREEGMKFSSPILEDRVWTAIEENHGLYRILTVQREAEECYHDRDRRFDTPGGLTHALYNTSESIDATRHEYVEEIVAMGLLESVKHVRSERKFYGEDADDAIAEAGEWLSDNERLCDRLGIDTEELVMV